MTKFESYSKDSIHFYIEKIPFLLESNIIKTHPCSILDAGCGDGQLLFALKNNNLLQNIKRIVGIDLSELRIKRMKNNLGYEGYVEDLTHIINLKQQSFDLIINAQVIEHIPEQDNALIELHKLLKKDGLLFISSIIKKHYAWYFYRNNNKWVLDRTHVREYGSINEFTSLLKMNKFKVIQVKTSQIWFSPMNFIIRKYLSIKNYDKPTHFYKNHLLLNLLKDIKIPIIGYKTIEVIAKKV